MTCPKSHSERAGLKPQLSGSRACLLDHHIFPWRGLYKTLNLAGGNTIPPHTLETGHAAPSFGRWQFRKEASPAATVSVVPQGLKARKRAEAHPHDTHWDRQKFREGAQPHGCTCNKKISSDQEIKQATP